MVNIVDISDKMELPFYANWVKYQEWLVTGMWRTKQSSDWLPKGLSCKVRYAGVKYVYNKINLYRKCWFRVKGYIMNGS